jgi:predicted naringenin-chalcone synthase
VDRLQKAFALEPSDLMPSRDVLRRYGNLSSATILFVLDELRERFAKECVNSSSLGVPGLTQAASSLNGFGNKLEPNVPATNGNVSGVAMAFGPGLVIEMARLTYLPVVEDAPRI